MKKTKNICTSAQNRDAEEALIDAAHVINEILPEGYRLEWENKPDRVVNPDGDHGRFILHAPPRKFWIIVSKKGDGEESLVYHALTSETEAILAGQAINVVEVIKVEEV